MGTNNRQRRAAKTRKRARRGSAAGSRPERPFAADRSTNEVCDCLRCRFDTDPRTALEGAGNGLVATVALMWPHGWQPNELVRQIRRSVSRDAADLVTLVVLIDDQRRGDVVKHTRWQRQVDALADASPAGLVAGDPRWTHWMWAWFQSTSVDHVDVINEIVIQLASLGQVHQIIPPPGEPAIDGTMSDDDTDDPTLARVRALLAQAESTTFPAEAEAFTAKAQALMSRHAIDEAMVRYASGVADRPVSVRLPIDDPYVSEKADLLHVVAEAARCRAIHHRDYAMSTVVGDTADLRRVEVLFTSLLLQAQAALNDESSTSSVGSHRRTRRFRAAFLAAYAVRIGQRLIAERDQAVEDSDDDVLPVLACQTQAVQDEVDRLFGGSLRHSRGKERDMAGWKAGSDAAERAALRESGLDSGPSGNRTGRPLAR